MFCDAVQLILLLALVEFIVPAVGVPGAVGLDGMISSADSGPVPTALIARTFTLGLTPLKAPTAIVVVVLLIDVQVSE